MNLRQKSKFLWQQMIVILTLSTLLSGQLFAQAVAPKKVAELSETELELKNKITIESIKKYTSTLAADDMEGRGTLQPGGDKAANYIAEQFKNLGLKPLGDKGSYLQAIKFKETVLTAETLFQVGDEKFQLGTDYAFVPIGFKKDNKKASGDLVFIAYGIQADSIKRDDLKGVNLKGKIAVMFEGPPASISKEDWERVDAQQAIFINLVRAGVAGIVTIPHGREKEPLETGIDYLGRRQIAMEDEDGRAAPVPIPPVMLASTKTAEKLFAKSGTSYKDALALAEQNSFKAFELNQKGNIVEKYDSSKGIGNNVVGYIEGSDPALKSEAVVFSAHYDAYGKLNGKIYNGAADNALGTAEMMAVAEAFSKMTPKPKRSLVFVAVTGEEYGLYGSKYWAKKPTWDIEKVAANLNLDGIGTEVYGPVKNMVGYGAEHSTLGTLLNDVAGSYGISVMPDPFPEEKVFYRSDHYSFVERGVPALMLLGAPEGTMEELGKRIKDWEKIYYHQPSDDVMDNWAWEGAETVAEMMGIMGLRIANTSAMPEWLKNGRFGELKRGNKKELPKDDESKK